MGYKGEFFVFTDRHFLGGNERKPQAHSLFSEMVKKFPDSMNEEGERFLMDLNFLQAPNVHIMVQIHETGWVAGKW